ncbi:HIRAN domain-containing protein [Sphingobium yanoikuyae]|uniref:HIRAN domain-containing protein n=1 Tax=Sphingobium yanoikuyae TaxID=13690 RepID=UPI0028A7D341|nr:HIRAN domain-containing protein [Sphingobium yanoikuyae]
MAGALQAMSLAVVGAQHPNVDGSDRRFEILLCPPGEPIELRPEPTNKHDPLAIAVYSARGVQIGYLSAERCGRIGQLMRLGHEVQAIFQGMSQGSTWIRVAFDGEAPALPSSSAMPTRDQDHGESIDDRFYPDEEWPDI